jgi:hypothetical protein
MVVLARNADMRGEQPERIVWRRNREARAPEFPRFLMPAERSETDLDEVLARFVMYEQA